MAWTTPATVTYNQLITSAFWNQQVRDNMIYLKDSLIAAGFIAATARSTAPTGWLLCDGAAIDRTTYAALFTAIGTTYGAGNGVSTFNVPDGLGRAMLGAGTGSGLTARARGDKSGAETVALDATTMPSHNHTGSTATFTGTQMQAYISSFPNWGQYWVTGGGSSFSYVNSSGAAASNYFTPAGSVSLSIASQGSGSAHNNMSPFWVGNYIIKT
jgi:microcystin-dependent protein